MLRRPLSTHWHLTSRTSMTLGDTSHRRWPMICTRTRAARASKVSPPTNSFCPDLADRFVFLRSGVACFNGPYQWAAGSKYEGPANIKFQWDAYNSDYDCFELWQGAFVENKGDGGFENVSSLASMANWTSRTDSSQRSLIGAYAKPKEVGTSARELQGRTMKLKQSGCYFAFRRCN